MKAYNKFEPKAVSSATLAHKTASLVNNYLRTKERGFLWKLAGSIVPLVKIGILTEDEYYMLKKESFILSANWMELISDRMESRETELKAIEDAEKESAASNN